MKAFIQIVLVVLLAGGCGSSGKATAIRSSGPVEPPAMPRRAIAKSATAPVGWQIQIEEGFTLFVPAAGAKSSVLTVHFHGEPWFIIEEHLRRGLRGPLMCVALGQGSNVYRIPFEDPNRFAGLVAQVEKQMQTKFAAIDISSFSAGYGAVREIVKSPEYRRIIRRIALCDSLYASFAANSTTRPAAENIDPWIPFVKLAAAGQKTFVLTHSQVPTATYANTAQCATALIEAVGGSRMIVPRGSIAATLDPDFPLLTRTDVGHFHIFGYDGADAQSHLTHVRHLADVWKALDAAGEP